MFCCLFIYLSNSLVLAGHDIHGPAWILTRVSISTRSSAPFGPLKLFLLLQCLQGTSDILLLLLLRLHHCVHPLFQHLLLLHFLHRCCLHFLHHHPLHHLHFLLHLLFILHHRLHLFLHLFLLVLLYHFLHLLYFLFHHSL